MSLSDCPKCWDTPCTCGHEYQDWSESRLEEFIKTLSVVLDKKRCGTDVTCECGRYISQQNIEWGNRTNEVGEEYGYVEAYCKHCHRYYETSQWGNFESIEEVYNLIQNYIKTML